MTLDQKIALGSAIIAFVSMLAAVLFSLKAAHSSRESLRHSETANRHADRANDISIGQTETALREQIALARQRMEDVGFKLQEVLNGRNRTDLSKEETVHLEFLEKSWNSSVEGYLNAYEDACGKYFDNKIDKKRFKKMYIEEIRNICDPERGAFSRHMHPDATSKFEAIWKVYKEWLRYEK